MPNLKILGLLAASVLFLSACELVVDFDRSLIVDASGDAPMTDAADSGADGGADSGADGGADSGADGGADSGADGGPDGGPDAGSDAGACVMPGDCDDAVACTVDDCVAMSCVQTPTDSLCDDANICTVNTCDAVMDCQATSCALAIATPAFPELSTVIRLTTVDGGEGGLIAVAFDDAAGVPDMALGAVVVPAGASADLDIELSRPAVMGEVIYVQLFVDMGDAGMFDVDDVAAQDATPMDVIDDVTVALAAGLPDFEVVVSGNGTDYNFSMARPSTLNINGADPVLELIRDRRYRIRNVLVGHPIEFIGGADVVQFAQGAGSVGALEADATVAWDESDPQDILFTVTTDFEAQVDAYWCRNHPVEMRAAVTYIDAP